MNKQVKATYAERKLFKNVQLSWTRLISTNLAGVLVILVQTKFPLDLLQVLLKESSSRKWLLFEYNDWTEPNEWFTIQGIQSIN